MIGARFVCVVLSHTAHDLPRRFIMIGFKTPLVDTFKEGVFLLVLRASNTPIEKRFYATVLENM